MRFYSTEYRVKKPYCPDEREKFTGIIYADSYGHACKLAVERNIGEFVTGVINQRGAKVLQPLVSELYKKRKLKECLHTLMFYGWIAHHAKVLRAVDLLSDCGLLHEIMHEEHHPGRFAFRQHLYDELVKLEKMIPGLRTYVVPLTEEQKVSTQSNVGLV